MSESKLFTQNITMICPGQPVRADIRIEGTAPSNKITLDVKFFLGEEERNPVNLLSFVLKKTGGEFEKNFSVGPQTIGTLGQMTYSFLFALAHEGILEKLLPAPGESTYTTHDNLPVLELASQILDRTWGYCGTKRSFLPGQQPCPPVLSKSLP